MSKRTLTNLVAASITVGAALSIADSSAAPAQDAAGMIVFARGGDIHAMTPDGSRRVRVTTGGPKEDDPAVSPDGHLLAFARVAGNGASTLWVKPIDRSQPARVVAAGGTNREPSWAPDGTIVFTHSDSPFGYCSALYRVRPDGTGLAPFLKTGGSVYSPDVSPAADVVHGAGGCEERGPGEPVIEVVDAGGTRTPDLERLNYDRFYFAARPAWSPDARQVAFMGGPDNDLTGIYVANRDGTQLRRVTLRRLTRANARFSDDEADWSPNGRRLVFTRYDSRSESADLYVIRPDGTGLRRLTGTSGNESSPTWVSRFGG